jgi:hypothetical protein
MPALAGTDLAKVARSCQAGKPKDCEKLQGIAKTHPDALVRLEATALLTDAAVLGSIAKEDNSEAVREAATKKVTDQRLLGSIAKMDAAEAVRKAASQQLTDQQLLAEIATGDRASSVRAAAAARLTNEALLRSVSDNSNDPQVRDAAKKRLGEASVCRSPWILSGGESLSLADPSVGVEVLQFDFGGSARVTLQGVSVWRTTFKFVDPDTLNMGQDIRVIVSARALKLTRPGKVAESVYVPARKCDGLPGFKVTLSGGQIWRIARQYCPAVEAPSAPAP